jgi:hypothetical protein
MHCDTCSKCNSSEHSPLYVYVADRRRKEKHENRREGTRCNNFINVCIFEIELKFQFQIDFLQVEVECYDVHIDI